MVSKKHNGRKAMHHSVRGIQKYIITAVQAMEDASIQVVFQIDRLMVRKLEIESNKKTDDLVVTKAISSHNKC